MRQADQTDLNTRQTLAPPKPLLLLRMTLGRCGRVARMMFRPSQAGSILEMWAEPGMKPSFMARAQKPASMAPASERPWPVSALVLLMAGRVGEFLKTALSARASERSPMGVEEAWALT